MWKYNWSVTENEDAIKKWQETGKSLGVLDPDYDAFRAEGTLKDPDVPDPYANSHGNDAVPDLTHAISLPMSESIVHEEHHFVPISAAYERTLAAFEAGPAESAQPATSGVKVI
jgi:hypothetical protein